MTYVMSGDPMGPITTAAPSSSAVSMSPPTNIASSTSLTAHITCRSAMIIDGTSGKHRGGPEHMLRVAVEPMEVMVDRPVNLLLDPAAPAYATL
jgi:hypothetical protein